MSNNNAKAVKASIVELPFHCIRNISSPEDQANNRVVYAGQVPLAAIVNIPTNENVRGYLVEAEGKVKKTRTQVHRAIRSTLEDIPDEFSVLNGGLVIVAAASEIEEKGKFLRLTNPSIINGSQTQGVVKDYLSSKVESGVPLPLIHVKFELIITADINLVAEISIARNFQNDVQLISIAGRRGQLDELELSIQRAFPSSKLQKSETQRPAEDNDYLQTEKILQVASALLPAELWWKPGDASKVYTYSQKATCLKDFQFVYQQAHDSSNLEQARFKDVYQFYLDVAPEALKLYERWKAHQGFAGCGLRSIERDGRSIKEVPDGIIFPILAAHSEFVVKSADGWRITPPVLMDDAELIKVAKSAYQEIAGSKPEIMGKTRACYSAIQQITSIYKKLLAR